MIVIKTNLKKIPDRCLKCRFCVNSGGIARKTTKYNNYIADTYTVKRCYITGREVPYVYNKDKRNWEYDNCKKCPLMVIQA
jgi:hypothetical protein